MSDTQNELLKRMITAHALTIAPPKPDREERETQVDDKRGKDKRNGNRDT